MSSDLEEGRFKSEKPTNLITFITPTIFEPTGDIVPDTENNILRLLERGILTLRETLVIEKIVELSPILYKLLKTTYPDQGWKVCGPASVALSRMLSYDFAIPIGTNIAGEHLELCIGIYDPVNRFPEEERKALMEEQTYLKYFSPQGNSFYIDAIYPLLMDDKSEVNSTIMVELYPTESFTSELARRQNVFSFESYPLSNLYYGEQEIWKMHFRKFQGNFAQVAGAANFLADQTEILDKMNDVAYDGIPVIFVGNSQYIVSGDFAILQAISHLPGYTTMYETLLERNQKIDLNTNSRMLEATMRYLKLQK